jgi:flagellar protein FlaG
METVNLVNTTVNRPENRSQSPAVTVTVDKTQIAADSVRQNDASGGNNVPEQARQNQPKTEKLVQESVSELNDFVQKIQRSLQFSVNEATGRTIISVKDTVTGEEIRTIPSEELIAIAEYLAETMAVSEEAGRGLLMNLQA